MTGNVLRYDPERIRDLGRRARAAATDLAGLTSDDPAAAGALRAVRQARDHLEHDWLPLLRGLAGSDAMLTWSSSVPVGLVESTDDPEAVDAVFTALGGAGTAELLLELGSQTDDADEALAAATAVRQRLVEASRRSGLPPTFARDFVDACVGSVDRWDRNPGVALSFLLGGESLGTAFLVSTTRAIVEHELAAAGDEPEYGGSLWGRGTGIGGPPSILIDPLDRAPGDSPELRPGGDPMMAVLDALTHDADAGRQVFEDEPVARYLLGERDYWMDGMSRLARAAAAAARDRPLVASAFVNHVGSRGAEEVLGLYDVGPVRDAAATILARHIASVHHAVLLPVLVDPPIAAAVPITDEVRSEPIVGALFDKAALDVVTSLAVGSVKGTAKIRVATDRYQQQQAAAGVERIADGEVDDPDRFLREALSDGARLEAHLVGHVGHRAEAMGRSRDDVITFWTDAACEAVDIVDMPGLDIVVDPAAAAMAEELTDHEAAAARDAEADADAAADRLTYAWYRELYDQGVVVPDLPASAVDGGALVTWGQFQALGARDRQTVRNLMEETTGAVNIDGNALRDVVKTQQLPIYDELR